MMLRVSVAIMVEGKTMAKNPAKSSASLRETGPGQAVVPSSRRFFRSQYHAIQMQIS
jgi:hypothetical protein